MQANRNIRLSIRNNLATLLGNMGYAYIYTEADMRAGITPNSSGSYVYLVDSMTKPMATTLPFVVLEVTNITVIPYEMGNRHGRKLDVFVHVFGNSRGVRDDIASYLQDAYSEQGSIPYNNYSSGSAAAYSFPIQLDGDGITVVDSPPPDREITEYSLANWSILSFSANTRE